MKAEGIPFKNVLERNFDINNEVIIPTITKKVKAKEDRSELVKPEKPTTKNIVMIDMIAGNLPLHGTKLLVRIAINLSLGESIIRPPTTPAALQPNPIHMVNACLPQAEQFLKHLSKLKAIRGR